MPVAQMEEHVTCWSSLTGRTADISRLGVSSRLTFSTINHGVESSSLSRHTNMLSMESVGFESHPERQEVYTASSFVQSVIVSGVAN